MPGGKAPGAARSLPLPVHSRKRPIEGPRCSVAAGELVGCRVVAVLSRPADTRHHSFQEPQGLDALVSAQFHTRGSASRVRGDRESSSSAGRDVRGRDEVRVPGRASPNPAATSRAVPAWCDRSSRSTGELPGFARSGRRDCTRRSAQAGGTSCGSSPWWIPAPLARARRLPGRRRPAHGSDRRRRGGRRDRSGHNARGPPRRDGAAGSTRASHRLHLPARHPPGGRRPRRKDPARCSCEDASLESQRRRSPRRPLRRPAGWEALGSGPGRCARSDSSAIGVRTQPGETRFTLTRGPSSTAMDIIIDCTAPFGGRVVRMPRLAALPGGAAE